MYELNKKLKDLIPYDPITGNYDVRVDANESPYDLDEGTKDKIKSALDNILFNRYPDPMAKGAIKAFADLYAVNPDFVTASNGSDELISIISSTFLETGDRVVTLSHDFSMYAFYGSIYETEALVFEKEEDLTIDVNKLIRFCNESKAKMLIFSNPCNPTSLGLDRDDVEKLLRCIDSSCLVVLDEAYMDFWSESMLEDVEEYDNLIILKTCSKALGLAGIRLGFAVAGKKITTALRAVKSPYNTDTVSQTIGEIVLKEKEMLSERLAKIIAGRNDLYVAISFLAQSSDKISEVYKTVTNFVFVKTDYATEIYEKMLEKSIAIRKFNGFIRISTGTEEENARIINALKEIL